MTKNAVLAACATIVVATVVGAAAVNLAAVPAAGARSTPDLVTEFNKWINGFLFSEAIFEWAGEKLGPKLAHYFLTWIRNFIAGSLLYYFTAACWHW